MSFSLHILFYYLNDKINMKCFCAFIFLSPLAKLLILVFPSIDKAKGFSSHFIII